MNTISNEQSNQAPFGAKNLAFAVSSGGVIWLCGKVSPILHSYYKDVPCHSPVQNPACATYTAAMVATTAMLILAVYGIAKAFVFDYHPGGRPFTLIKQQPNAEEVPQTKTNSFFQSSQSGSSARYAHDVSQSAAGKSPLMDHYNSAQKCRRSQSF